MGVHNMWTPKWAGPLCACIEDTSNKPSENRGKNALVQYMQRLLQKGGQNLMNVKRLLALLLALGMLMSLAACGGGNTQPAADDTAD